jgi:NAD(P)-dependent dehydrogenase (short-subunit alcohol dehydrogenase family)
MLKRHRSDESLQLRYAMSLSNFTATFHHEPYPAIYPSRVELSAQGKVVIVTGGGKGIGKATALAFAKAQAKAIVITGRTETTLERTSSDIQKLGSKSMFYVADVTDSKRMHEIFSAVKAQFGSIDIVVSNAAYLSDLADIHNAPVDEWWAGFEVNVKGGLIVTQAFLQNADAGATLINISTGLVHMYFGPSLSSYTASKLATARLLEDTQAEYPQFRIFNVHPGIIQTEMNTKSQVPPQDSGTFLHVTNRLVDLPADFAVWLSSPEANFVKGRFLWANWDVDELKNRAQEITGNFLKTGLIGFE